MKTEPPILRTIYFGLQAAALAILTVFQPRPLLADILMEMSTNGGAPISYGNEGRLYPPAGSNVSIHGYSCGQACGGDVNFQVNGSNGFHWGGAMPCDDRGTSVTANQCYDIFYGCPPAHDYYNYHIYVAQCPSMATCGGSSGTGSLGQQVCGADLRTYRCDCGNVWNVIGSGCASTPYNHAGQVCNCNAICPSICGGTFTNNCDNTCSPSTTPPDPRPTCYSAYDPGGCGTRNSAIGGCNGSCSGYTPAAPPDPRPTCYSTYNNCGMRNSAPGNCNGTCPYIAPPANPAVYNQVCGNCGQRTDCSGVCPPDPAVYNTACDATTYHCGQLKDCGGACAADPAVYNQPCDSSTYHCGQKKDCSGACTADPAVYGQACTPSTTYHCGQTMDCSGACTADPAVYDLPCSPGTYHCGQTQNCGGACTADPVVYNKPCNPSIYHCGQRKNCSGACAADPVVYGQACTPSTTYHCGQTMDCSGACAADPVVYNKPCNPATYHCGQLKNCGGACAADPAVYNQPCDPATYHCGQLKDCNGACTADPVIYGTPCTSAPNACGVTANGAYDCTGTCSAITPPNPLNFGNPCTALDACGFTIPGTVGCDAACNGTASAVTHPLQSYEVPLKVSGGAIDPKSGTPVYNRGLCTVVAQKTLAAVLPNGVRASVALELMQPPVDASGLVVHWGPAAVFADAAWTVANAMDVSQFPRKFSQGTITGTIARSKPTDNKEYWANTSLGFPNVIDTNTYRGNALAETGITPPTCKNSAGNCSITGGVITVANNDTAVFSNGYTLTGPLTIYVNGNAELGNVILDLESAGAFIVNGNLTLNTPGAGRVMALRVPPTSPQEYPFLSTWPCKSNVGKTCLSDGAGGRPGPVQFRGFLYVTGNLTVNNPGWLIDGALRVDGTMTVPASGTAPRLTLLYDDEINHAILVTPLELMVDYQKEIAP